jgi:glutamyl endopeptidase
VAHVRGYPGDVSPAGSMWTDRKRIRVTQANMVFYRNDTFGGQSGSPIFQWGRYCDGPCAMGVHGYGIGHLPGTPHQYNNHGVRITTSRESLIASIAGRNA